MSNGRVAQQIKMLKQKPEGSWFNFSSVLNRNLKPKLVKRFSTTFKMIMKNKVKIIE